MARLCACSVCCSGVAVGNSAMALNNACARVPSGAAYVADRLTRGERVTFKGAHFDVRDYSLHPRDKYRARPRIYVGGESEPARALAADWGDVWFVNGQPLADTKALLDDMAARPRPFGTPIR